MSAIEDILDRTTSPQDREQALMMLLEGKLQDLTEIKDSLVLIRNTLCRHKLQLENN